MFPNTYRVFTTYVEDMEKLNGRRRWWVRGCCIGRGAYGTVNLALNLFNANVFAVKSVQLCSSYSTQLQALENEIAILKSLSSPYVVMYLGDDQTTSFRNLHMEYLPSGTASDNPGNFDVGSIGSYTWCVVSALSYIHSKGIVHCDVKGKNVLLGSTPGSAKLADFGSAARISAKRIPPRGSPLWMAPEVARGEYQGPESDVWSLGCTVIEMITGRPAWDSLSQLGHSAELPLFPSDLSKSGCDFLSKCLQRDFRKRWSCDQLLQHPFISNCNPSHLISDSSPRCILDLPNLNFDEEPENNETDDEDLNSRAKGRIRGLISGAGANWESGGWIMVRGGDWSGTMLEYYVLIGANEESFQASMKVDDVVAPECIKSEPQKNVYTRCKKKICFYLYIHFCVYIFFILSLFGNIISFVTSFLRNSLNNIKNQKKFIRFVRR